MIKSFLTYVAEDIYKRYGADLSRLTVVFPNKRAALFLNQELARMAEKPIWAPAYVTISELFRSRSQLSIANPIQSVCLLHKSYTSVTGIDETLDHFFGWGNCFWPTLTTSTRIWPMHSNCSTTCAISTNWTASSISTRNRNNSSCASSAISLATKPNCGKVYQSVVKPLQCLCRLPSAAAGTRAGL